MRCPDLGPNVRFVLAPGVTRRGGAVVLALVVVACSSSGPKAATTTAGESTTTGSPTTTTTAPERGVSTTTTAFDPESVEGQVEAAYLRSWDVYADAVYNLELDEEALAEVYAERSLGTRKTEIEERVANGRASLVVVDHDYEVIVVDEGTAAVLDSFINHQVLIDPESKTAIEPDPNQALVVNFQMKLLGGSWRVTLIQKVSG